MSLPSSASPAPRNHRRSLRRTAAVLAVAALAVSACGARAGETAAGGAESASGGLGTSCVDTSGDTIRVGFINSLSGTMAISETTVFESLTLAAEEINENGGVLGKQIEIVSEDGASEPSIFAERSERLIQQECVAAVFGGWTSASRKAMLPVFEAHDSLLFYPVQYEGMESSENIFYSGATTNQQIIPALDYLVEEQGATSLYLVGSDYVFPRTANAIIKAYAEENGIEILGEDYTPLGSTDFTTIVNRVQSSGADAVFNTLNGDSNVAFFRQYNSVGLDAETMPVMSVSIAEEEIEGIGAENIEGQLTAWNYYQTLETPENEAFVEQFKAAQGEDRVTSDPMEAAYTGLYLWKAMVEEADSFATDDVRAAAGEVSFNAPEGTVSFDPGNQHLVKTPRIGQVNEDGLIDIVWATEEAVEPDPFLEGYDWASSLASSLDTGSDS